MRYVSKGRVAGQHLLLMNEPNFHAQVIWITRIYQNLNFVYESV